MKVLIFTDNHFCEVSSIVRKFGTKYSVRLENGLESLNWLEKLAVEKGCEAVICAGDFFNTPNLNENEITAVRDIQWNGLPHCFLVGNHESGVSDLQYNSTKVLESTQNTIVSTVQSMQIAGTELMFLPYIVESDRKPLESYCKPRTGRRIIISHNDIKGIQMGPVVSQSGFTLDEIEANCDLFINGHLHNGTDLTKKVINLGNLTGQNFSEDALKYKHNIMILDTDTLTYELIENPHAIKFYKFDLLSAQAMSNFEKTAQYFTANNVFSIKCLDKYRERLTDCFESVLAGKVLETKIMLVRENSEEVETSYEELTLDHLVKLHEFCVNKLGDNDIILYELAEICK